MAEMVGRLTSSESVGPRRGARRSDAALEARCRALSDRYLDGRAAAGQCAVGSEHADSMGLMHARGRLDPRIGATALCAQLGA